MYIASDKFGTELSGKVSFKNLDQFGNIHEFNVTIWTSSVNTSPFGLLLLTRSRMAESKRF
jgi:hypothetical protein